MASYVWFITAASSGFGKSIALEALSRGHKVIATARDTSSLTLLQEKGAAVLSVDVNASEENLAAKLKEASEIHGKITHVVNPAGYILAGAVEEASQREVLNHYATNVFGVANIARAAAPYLRASAKEGDGPVAYAAFGSLGSYRSGAALAHYCSSKAAVSLLTEGLAEEWAPFGISVCCVEPGYTRTEFLSTEAGKERRVVAKRSLEVYAEGPVAAYKGALDQFNGKQLGDVEKCARVIVDVLTQEGVGEGRKIPVRLPLGSDTLAAVKENAERELAMVREWESIAKLTDGDN
ncbi:hypothetical protein DL546_000885 [Coniochaeta pulveracea]|uniref:Uncharacterized protein n=1 Tax=Coniochaeta pulveracea TaxID=177199 RepID=A0A420XVW1_9PEZI|nr:hypothetical protein DL546_000885 [Coniochaeta pulveracea]